MKDFFQLREMEVPLSEERLRWSLSRFLEAAAKKHDPARIVIVIDGVNRLRAEGAADGALHWLPTDLPSTVRFIVSTVEYDRQPGKLGCDKDTSSHHRTYTELKVRVAILMQHKFVHSRLYHATICFFSQINHSAERARYCEWSR